MRFNGDGTLTVGDETFQICETIEDLQELRDENGLVLGKPTAILEIYRDHLDPSAVDTMFELGIFRGGSVPFFDRHLRPLLYAAIDISQPIERLESWLDRKQARDRVKTFYHVDQTDAPRLREICDSVFGDKGLDLVIDDASHRLDETRASFNALFPRVNAGGWYVIEDWAILETLRDYLDDETRQIEPMSRLIHEIVQANARSPQAVDRVMTFNKLVMVRRGPAALDASFDIRTMG